MIDGLFRERSDPWWERAARPLARAGVTPNQVTAAGTLLIAVACGAFVLHGSALLFGLTLTLASLFDALDGAVARLRRMQSKRGGYLDAMADRYQELAVLAAIGAVTGLWPLALFAFAGGVFTSYAKARAALEMPVSNRKWPDLFERAERSIFLCTLLIVSGIVAALGYDNAWLLGGGLAVYAALTHLTALQRMTRVLRMLAEVDGEREATASPEADAPVAR